MRGTQRNRPPPCVDNGGSAGVSFSDRSLEDLRRLSHQIERALVHTGGTHTVEDIASAISSGQKQLWAGTDSAIVTQIVITPQKKELWFFLAAGNMEEVQRMYPLILEWGREQGCVRATFVGRRGWARTFLTREEGWRETLAVFEKEI